MKLVQATCSSESFDACCRATMSSSPSSTAASRRRSLAGLPEPEDHTSGRLDHKRRLAASSGTYTFVIAPSSVSSKTNTSTYLTAGQVCSTFLCCMSRQCDMCNGQQSRCCQTAQRHMTAKLAPPECNRCQTAGRASQMLLAVCNLSIYGTNCPL